MIRTLRLTLYFLVGVSISLFLLAPAHAQVQTVMKFAPQLEAVPLDVLKNNAATSWLAAQIANGSATDADFVRLTTQGSVKFLANEGKEIPIPMTLKKNITPSQIAGNIAGGLIKGGLAPLAAGLVLEAGIEYAAGKWTEKGEDVAPVSETCAGNTCTIPAVSTSKWSASSYGNPPLFDSAQEACNASINTWYADNPAYHSGWSPVLPGTVVALSPVYSECRRLIKETLRPTSTQSIGYSYFHNVSSISCPTGQGWNLVSSTCERPSCPTGSVHDGAGVCRNPAGTEITYEQAKEKIENKVRSYPDPSLLLKEWPTSLNPDPNIDPWEAPSTLSGPSTVQGPATVKETVTPATTTTPAQKITTTTVPTANTVYNNNTATTTITNTTTVTNNAGDVISETKEDATPDEVAQVNDTPLGDIPKLYQKKYPDGMQGAWNTRSAEMKATPLFGLSALFAPSVASGTCPSWNLNMNIGPKMNFGNGSISPPCWIWTAIKAIMIITALLISRRLVFGG